MPTASPGGKILHYTTLANFLDINSQSRLQVLIDSSRVSMDDHPVPPHDLLVAMTAALAASKPNPPTVTLKTPTFDWSASELYEKFQLFWESLNSWFHFQGMLAEPEDNGNRIEYVLNFLETTEHR